jgi:hypothetical protein
MMNKKKYKQEIIQKLKKENIINQWGYLNPEMLLEKYGVEKLINFVLSVQRKDILYSLSVSKLLERAVRDSEDIRLKLMKEELPFDELRDLQELIHIIYKKEKNETQN